MDIEDKIQAERMAEMMAYAAGSAKRKIKQKKEETTVLRSWPMEDDEKVAFAEVVKLKEEMVKKHLEPMKKLMAKLSTKRSKFWAMVEERLDEYDLKLHVNKKTEEIESVERTDDDDDEVDFDFA